MKLSDMKQLLAEHGIQLTKSLGQNFLHDANQLQRIVASANLTTRDNVLEIGPGLGPLTELLLRSAGHLLALEKDRRLVEFLRQRFGAAPNLELRHADALKFVQEHPDLRDWKVVSNLPYSVASPILVELARSSNSPQLIVATLQLEVAHRLTASCDSKEYGLLSLLIQLRYEVMDQFKIPASCFFPEPDVDSACVTLTRRAALLDPVAESAFVQIIKRAFSQRRKMMLKLLKEDWPDPLLKTAFAQIGISLQARAETVSLEQFVELARILSPLNLNLKTNS
jgi:16S rRNA (adenine1518-N6/adenine1519-N6)-dimethyltransferase